MHFNIKNILETHGFGDKNDYQNVYIQLYESIKNAIIGRTLDANVKLPPSRVLAKDLQVSRSTVIKAYDLLLLEKFIISKVGSGYFVASMKRKKINHSLNSQIIKGKYPAISKRGNAFRKNILLKKEREGKGIAFRPGLPPLDIFPIQQWKSLSNEYWKTVTPSQLSYSNTIGQESLRNSISNYLKIYRNVHCNPEQVVITTGSLHSLSLICDAIIDRKDEVIIENPTYPHAYNLFDSLKAKIIAADIDDEGMNINMVKSKSPKLIYTTPSNQYPTGVKMSIKRRFELLAWASKKNALIVEDDYDHEFSNWEKPIASMFSLDNQDRVIYLGTFNKLLHPSIRLGYMIVPHYLLDTIIALYEQSNRFVSPPLQETLNAFIEKDYLNKHLRRVIETSIERKKIFCEAFTQKFEDKIALDSNNTGLHIIGKLNDSIDDRALANYLSKQKIIAHPFSNYFVDGIKKNGLVMGYSSVNNKLIKETINRMEKEYSSFVNLT